MHGRSRMTIDPRIKGRQNVSRIQQAFLQVWNPDKPDMVGTSGKRLLITIIPTSW